MLRLSLVAALLVLAGCSTGGASQEVSPEAVLEVVAPLPPLDPLPGVEMVSRAAWGAEPLAFAIPSQTPNAITIHHTAVMQRPDLTPEAKMQSLQRFSLSSDTLDDGSPKKAWADVPYHFYVASDGTILEGRDVRLEGDTNTDYDLTGQIQIVAEGNFEEEQPTTCRSRACSRSSAPSRSGTTFRATASKATETARWARRCAPGSPSGASSPSWEA